MQNPVDVNKNHDLVNGTEPDAGAGLAGNQAALKTTAGSRRGWWMHRDCGRAMAALLDVATRKCTPRACRRIRTRTRICICMRMGICTCLRASRSCARARASAHAHVCTLARARARAGGFQAPREQGPQPCRDWRGAAARQAGRGADGGALTAPAPSYHPLASPFLPSLGLTLPTIPCRCSPRRPSSSAPSSLSSARCACTCTCT